MFIMLLRLSCLPYLSSPPSSGLACYPRRSVRRRGRQATLLLLTNAEETFRDYIHDDVAREQPNPSMTFQDFYNAYLQV